MTGIESALIGIHFAIATFSGAKHWELDAGEAKNIGTAIERVAAHYPAFARSQRMADWIFLLTTMGTAYGPRIAVSVMVRPKSTTVGNVTPFPQPAS